MPNAPESSSKPNRPNILVFITDDHGKWASGCYGNRELMTPALDQLARTGARMTHAFTPNPVCSPARASFFTGRFPSQHGIHDWLNECEPVGRAHPALNGQIILPELLQLGGYETALVGKWHCGSPSSPRPASFDRWFSHAVNQYPHRGPIRFQDQDRIVEFDGYQSHELTRQAIEFIRSRPRPGQGAAPAAGNAAPAISDTSQAKGQAKAHAKGQGGQGPTPFFMVVGYSDTHTPYSDHPPRLVDHYRRCSFSDIPEETPAACHGHVRLQWFADPVVRREKLAQYYAAVSFIDEQVGRILDELQTTAMLEQTLVVYISDHGHMNGHHGLNSKGNATIPQNLIDDSMRVPCLLSWPGVIAPGAAPTIPVDHCDLFQTLLECAGVDVPPELASRINSPGRSYLPTLRGQSQTWRDAVFGEYANARSARTDFYKLIRRYPGPNGHFPDEFYDLRADPRERRNVIADAEYADAVADLSRRLDAHFSRYEDPARAGTHIADLPKGNTSSSWLIPPDSVQAHG